MGAIKNLFQRLYPCGVCRTGTAVYLTFDDGPIPEVTPKVLEILARYNVKATFFMVGENIDKHPDIFAQVVAGGHSIANHTYNHMKGWNFRTKTYLENVEKWEEVVNRQPCAPVNRRKIFRPPYGRTWWWQRKALVNRGYTIYLWDVLTRDYNKSRTPEEMFDQIKRQTRPGSLINFHDSMKSNERMLEVLPKAIEWLQKEGYELAAL